MKHYKKKKKQKNKQQQKNNNNIKNQDMRDWHIHKQK